MHDLVIRGGLMVDGTGAEPVEADVAIDDGLITAVGPDLGEARHEIDARGRWVTPGFVDIHTHYDAQATWDPHLLPSGWHGVTTTVFGNCGVGFAPAKPDRREWLIGLMEGVEDIPGAALSEGIQWNWETFPEYLDALESTPLAKGVDSRASRYSGKVSQFHWIPSLRAAPGMSSTPSIKPMSHSRRSGLAGAKPTPQFPKTVVVTPCQPEGRRWGSQVACAS